MSVRLSKTVSYFKIIKIWKLKISVGGGRNIQHYYRMHNKKVEAIWVSAAAIGLVAVSNAPFELHGHNIVT